MKKLTSFDEYFEKRTAHDPKLRAEIEAGAARIAIACQLMNIRESMGLTQRELARRLGVTQQLISKIEKGANNTTLDTLLKVFFMLNVAIEIHVGKLKPKGRVLQFV